MSTAPIGLMSYERDSKKIKHNHPHTNIFVDIKPQRKCRFKKGSKLYFINNQFSIENADIISTEFLEYLKVWRISTTKGYFIDTTKESTSHKILEHNLGKKIKYPYKKKYNALSRLRKQIKDKLWQIEEEMENEMENET